MVMTKEQLIALGLDETQIKEVFRLNGLAVTRVQTDLDSKVQELADVKGLLSTANEKIEEFKNLDVDTIKQEAQDYKQKFEQAQLEAEQKIGELKYETALKEYVNKHQFASDRVKNSIFNDLKTKEFKLEEGQFLGADDYIKQLQEKEPESFAAVGTQTETLPKFTRPAINDDDTKTFKPKTIAELADEINIRK